MTSTDNERLSIEEIIKIASEAAVEKYKQMEADKCEQEREKARKNTKRLLKGYKEQKNIANMQSLVLKTVFLVIYK